MKILNFFLIGLLAFTISCGKVSDKAIPSNATISGDQLSVIMHQEIGHSTLSFTEVEFDNSFILPTEEWVKTDFTVQIRKFIFDYNLRIPRAEQRDCDDYAEWGAAMARALNRQSTSGIAVGRFCYIEDGVVVHVTNVIIVAGEDKKPHVLYFDPQVQEFITLSPEEKASCLNFIF